MVLALVGAVAMAQAGPRDSVTPPDADFLEFLGSWHTGDDRWIDPFQLDEASDQRRGERKQDRQSHGDYDDRRNQRVVVPRENPKQPESDSAIPRRDMKP